MNRGDAFVRMINAGISPEEIAEIQRAYEDCSERNTNYRYAMAYLVGVADACKKFSYSKTGDELWEHMVHVFELYDLDRSILGEASNDV